MAKIINVALSDKMVHSQQQKEFAISILFKLETIITRYSKRISSGTVNNFELKINMGVFNT